MHSAIFALVALASVATAAPSGSAIIKRCEPTEVMFHYNTTELGSKKSCSGDVMERGSNSPSNMPRAALGARDEAPCVDGPIKEYYVKRDETLEKIAVDHNSAVCNIAYANGIQQPDFIDVGQRLMVPTHVCQARIDNTSCRIKAGTATCVKTDATTYIIQPRDTFFLIAAKLGITLQSLLDVNQGVEPSTLYVNQVINLPPKCPEGEGEYSY